MQKRAEEEAEAPDEDDDGYGSDLMGDDEDRARLAALTEMEREMELFERSEARDRRREARRNARLLKQPLLKEQAWAPHHFWELHCSRRCGTQCLARLVDQALCYRRPACVSLCMRRRPHIPDAPVISICTLALAACQVQGRSPLVCTQCRMRPRSSALSSCMAPAAQAGEAMRSSTRVKVPDTAKKSALAELAAKKARADKARSKKRCVLGPCAGTSSPRLPDFKLGFAYEGVDISVERSTLSVSCDINRWVTLTTSGARAVARLQVLEPDSLLAGLGL